MNSGLDEEDINKRIFPQRVDGSSTSDVFSSRSSTPTSEDDDRSPFTEESVEAWLDTHEDFVQSYFSRKANRFLLDSLLRGRIRSSRTSSPLPPVLSSQLSLGGASSGTQTPSRKISTDLDRGFLKPLVNLVDGTPSFLTLERSPSRSCAPRQRKSKEELQELRILDEHALLIELVQDIANDLEITSLCHKILQNVSILTDGDRCSLFLVQDYGNDTRYLVSKVYDVNADSNVEDMESKEEIKVEWGMGIVGFTADSGEKVNIPDAYAVRISVCVNIALGQLIWKFIQLVIG